MSFEYYPPMSALNVVDCDNDFIILNKPSGLLSVPGRKAEHKDSLQSRVQSLYPTATTVHRLDMDTSGLVVMALNKAAHVHISRQFENKSVQKSYISLVDGIVEDDTGVIDLPLRCDWPNRPLQMVDSELGKRAVTHWQVLERLQDRTRLLLKPETGRSHQLRVHCLNMGHPILGDRFYAVGEQVTKVKRLCLHAQALAFYHPSREQEVFFEVPADF
jgi:tRNA pseudouridine32 synthase / 23S rRNA pseudouridine746 synthase